MGRILAIDYGKKRVGLAVTDPLQIIANGLTTVEAKTAYEYIVEYANGNDISTIVVGLPTQMNGEFSESYKYIEPFVNRLKKGLPKVEIVYYDERFTSKLAMRAMIDAGVKKSDRQKKELVDMVSATIILQSYMESLSFRIK